MSFTTLVLIVLAQVGLVDPDTVPTVDEPIFWTSGDITDSSSSNDKGEAEQVEPNTPMDGTCRISNGF